MSEKNLSRRNFLKTAAVTGAAMSVAGAAPAFGMPVNIPAKWDYSADIIIIGAGGAGLSAAGEAADLGMSVIVLEKEPIMGGSSIICGGALAFAGTDEQKAKGIKDSNDIFFKDLMEVGGYVNNPEVVKSYLSTQLEMYRWLKDHGVEFDGAYPNSGMSVARRHNVKPEQVMKTLNDYALSKGVKIMLNATADRLVYDDKNKKICGVTGKYRNKAAAFHAKKAVLLASGGYARNPEFLQQFTPTMEGVKVIAGLGSTGDGIKMAMAYGADLIDTPYIKATFGFSLNPFSMADYVQFFYSGAIIVNKKGRRIVKESISYKLLGDACLEQEDGVAYQIFDETIRQALYKMQPGKAVIENKAGNVFKANSIKEVARMAGIDPVEAEKTVKNYNSYVDKGHDPEFGRQYLAGSVGNLTKIETGPFYCMPSSAVILATYCGVRIKPDTRVTDVFGETIPGLYAAGEITGGFHGEAYLNGTSFGKSMVFGKIAARAIAKA